jgi:apolipoprotein D and lipocalin family protein
MYLRFLAFALVAFVAGTLSAATQPPQPLELVDDVDLSRYAGSWYEVARFPNKFQKKCVGDVTATYTLRSDGSINVVNKCREADGKWNDAEGVAKLDREVNSNAALQVRFAPAFLSLLPNVWGDYRIIGLDPDYRWSVVGEPKREYLWILSRTPEMSEKDYSRATAIAEANGFDVSKLVRTPHSDSR